jgi:hypothetical protein
MGCAVSTAVGYELSETEAAELAVLEPHEEVGRVSKCMRVCGRPSLSGVRHCLQAGGVG